MKTCRLLADIPWGVVPPKQWQMTVFWESAKHAVKPGRWHPGRGGTEPEIIPFFHI